MKSMACDVSNPKNTSKTSIRMLGSIGEYLAGTFVDQVRRWNVFSVERLARTEHFLRVV